MEFTKDGKYKMTDGQGKVTVMSYKVVGNEVKIDGPVNGIFDLNDHEADRDGTGRHRQNQRRPEAAKIHLRHA